MYMYNPRYFLHYTSEVRDQVGMYCMGRIMRIPTKISTEYIEYIEYMEYIHVDG